jgi:large subunit ribosomal protein L29
MARPMEKLRDLGPQELTARERDLTDQVFRLRFQMNTGQSEGLKKLRLARRDLARVKTLLREGELNRPPAAHKALASAHVAAHHVEAGETKIAAPPKAKPARAKAKHAKPKAAKLKGHAPKSAKKSGKAATKPGAKPRSSHGK